jgi:hypothetical protein
MYDEDVAELILTADGIVKNIVFIEELIEAAPAFPNWKITALKQAVDMADWQIGIEELIINSPSLSFSLTNIRNILTRLRLRLCIGTTQPKNMVRLSLVFICF